MAALNLLIYWILRTIVTLSLWPIVVCGIVLNEITRAVVALLLVPSRYSLIKSGKASLILQQPCPPCQLVFIVSDEENNLKEEKEVIKFQNKILNKNDEKGRPVYRFLYKRIVTKLRFACFLDDKDTIFFDPKCHVRLYHHANPTATKSANPTVLTEERLLTEILPLLKESLPLTKPQWELLIFPKVKLESSESVKTIRVFRFHPSYAELPQICSMLSDCYPFVTKEALKEDPSKVNLLIRARKKLISLFQHCRCSPRSTVTIDIDVESGGVNNADVVIDENNPYRPVPTEKKKHKTNQRLQNFLFFFHTPFYLMQALLRQAVGHNNNPVAGSSATNLNASLNLNFNKQHGPSENYVIGSDIELSHVWKIVDAENSKMHTGIDSSSVICTSVFLAIKETLNNSQDNTNNANNNNSNGCLNFLFELDGNKKFFRKVPMFNTEWVKCDEGVQEEEFLYLPTPLMESTVGRLSSSYYHKFSWPCVNVHAKINFVRMNNGGKDALHDNIVRAAVATDSVPSIFPMSQLGGGITVTFLDFGCGNISVAWESHSSLITREDLQLLANTFSAKMNHLYEIYGGKAKDANGCPLTPRLSLAFNCLHRRIDPTRDSAPSPEVSLHP